MFKTHKEDQTYRKSLDIDPSKIPDIGNTFSFTQADGSIGTGTITGWYEPQITPVEKLGIPEIDKIQESALNRTHRLHRKNQTVALLPCLQEKATHVVLRTGNGRHIERIDRLLETPEPGSGIDLEEVPEALKEQAIQLAHSAKRESWQVTSAK